MMLITITCVIGYLFGFVGVVIWNRPIGSKQGRESARAARSGEFFAKFGERFVSRHGFFLQREGRMNTSTTTAEKVLFKFRDLEITGDALVLHFHEESTVIPLSEIRSYRLNWYLHDPVFAKKWWFLVLDVTLKNGDEESGHVTSVKFNYLTDDSELRKDIEAKIARAVNAALSRAKANARNGLSLTSRGKPGSAVEAKGWAQ